MPQKKILFACIPADGHFNPMTALAIHLKIKGYDVRWYTGKVYKNTLHRIGIPYLPFRNAQELTIEEIDQVYPDRKMLKGIAHIKFDIINLFINRMKGYYEDIAEIHEVFPFDILVCDNTFPGSIVKKKLNIPIASIGVIPLALSAPDLPLYGIGHKPATTFFGKRKQNFIKLMADKLIFNETKVVYNQLLRSLDLPEEENLTIFDIAPLQSDVFLQNGIPEIDYPRYNLPETIKYVGALQVQTNNNINQKAKKDWSAILDTSKKVILVSQGTVEKNLDKLIIPSLEAFKNSNYVVLVATGYTDTKDLQKRYPQQHFYIEDFIAYDAVMPHTNIFIMNGGYGSALLSIKHSVPMITAGVNEGKNEICSRIDYSGIGIDLKTEKPRVVAIQNATERILGTDKYLEAIQKIQKCMNSYNTIDICEQHITRLISE
jgi:UDP:flavonoid glycosyltransferase YjiC (YdhE family)